MIQSCQCWYEQITWKVVTGKVRRLTESLVAIETIFNWALQGPCISSSVTGSTCTYISPEEDAQISKQLHAFKEVGPLGFVNEKSQSPEETEALQSFEETLTYKWSLPCWIAMATWQTRSPRQLQSVKGTAWKAQEETTNGCNAVRKVQWCHTELSAARHLWRYTGKALSSRTTQGCEILHATSCCLQRG